MPLYRRVVKKGFSNYPFKKEYVGLNLRELENKVQDGETVTLDSLRQKGLVKKSARYVKLLGEGELTKKVTVQGLKVSKSAAEKIHSAGGTVVAEEAATSEKAQGSETGDQSKTEGTESDESES
jgi:large subunit ribosomal protein L15